MFGRKFFQQRILNLSFVQSFKGFHKIFQTFRNPSTSKKVVDLRTTGQLYKHLCSESAVAQT